MSRRSAPEVNAGSMADIAFLLLIFFLVTTTIQTDEGISRKLPPIQEDNKPPPPIKKKNIFIVIVNKKGDLLVEDKPMELKNLRAAAKKFLDNGGGTGAQACSYCKGNRDPESSDNPTKAIISVQNDRQTRYGMYIAVQNELVGAFKQLRNRAAQSSYGESFEEMEKNFNDARFTGDKALLKKHIKTIRKMYPLNLSEAEPEKG